MPRSAPGRLDAPAVEQHLAGGRLVEAGDDAQQRALAAARRAEDGDEVVLGDVEVGRLQRHVGAPPACAGKLRVTPRTVEERRHASATPLLHRPSCAHGNRRRFSHLNSMSLTRPMTPMTMIPKMIWSVASSAWLSVIMWPMPLDAPISSATIT